MGKIHLLTGTWREWLAAVRQSLALFYPAQEAEALAWWVVEEFTHLSRTELIVRTEAFSLPQVPLNDTVQRLQQYEPIQYIFGHTFWHGLELIVTPDTLIPRPETGEMTDWLLHNEPNIPLRVLDAGTGTGCIAIALKKARPAWQITAIDTNSCALNTAQENAQRNGVDILWKQQDMLLPDEQTWDIIVSNPPYIPLSDRETIDANVAQYEPQQALFVPDHRPLLFYEALSAYRCQTLYTETHERYADAVAERFRQAGFINIEIKHDSYGKPRMVRASRLG